MEFKEQLISINPWHNKKPWKLLLLRFKFLFQGKSIIKNPIFGHFIALPVRGVCVNLYHFWYWGSSLNFFPIQSSTAVFLAALPTPPLLKITGRVCYSVISCRCTSNVLHCIALLPDTWLQVILPSILFSIHFQWCR